MFYMGANELFPEPFSQCLTPASMWAALCHPTSKFSTLLDRILLSSSPLSLPNTVHFLPIMTTQGLRMGSLTLSKLFSICHIISTLKKNFNLHVSSWVKSLRCLKMYFFLQQLKKKSILNILLLNFTHLIQSFRFLKNVQVKWEPKIFILIFSTQHSLSKT